MVALSNLARGGSMLVAPTNVVEIGGLVTTGLKIVEGNKAMK